MVNTFERFLTLTEKDVKDRMECLEKRLPSRRKLACVRVMAKNLDTPALSYINYRAKYNCEELEGDLHSYEMFMGNGSKGYRDVIMEQLREKYITERVLAKLKRGIQRK